MQGKRRRDGCQEFVFAGDAAAELTNGINRRGENGVAFGFS